MGIMRKGDNGSNPVALRLLPCKVGLVLGSCRFGSGGILSMQTGLRLGVRIVGKPYETLLDKVSTLSSPGHGEIRNLHPRSDLSEGIPLLNSDPLRGEIPRWIWFSS